MISKLSIHTVREEKEIYLQLFIIAEVLDKQINHTADQTHYGRAKMLLMNENLR
jgi:hypothetical protein